MFTYTNSHARPTAMFLYRVSIPIPPCFCNNNHQCRQIYGATHIHQPHPYHQHQYNHVFNTTVQNKAKGHQCPNCGLAYPNKRSMTGHYNYCILDEALPNCAPTKYTTSEFNSEIANGNINPHSFKPGMPFNNQLHSFKSIRQQAKEIAQNASTSFQEPNEPNVEFDCHDDELPDAPQDRIDQSELLRYEQSFTESQGEAMTHSDVNLDPNLPAMFKDVSIMYARIKHAKPP
jgi:hypothetical protein